MLPTLNAIGQFMLMSGTWPFCAEQRRGTVLESSVQFLFSVHRFLRSGIGTSILSLQYELVLAKASDSTDEWRMTVAVCLRCGELKHGAWTTCPQCGYIPDDDESFTKHLLVTDHYYSVEQLKELAARVKAGETIEFDAETLKEAWVKKADVDEQQRGCTVGCIGVLVVVLLAIAALVAWQLW